MATNYVGEGKQYEVTVATTVDSNDPVILGDHTPGVALVDANSTTGKCVVQFDGIFKLKVAGKSDGGTAATVTAGDMIFYTSGATAGSGTVVLNKYPTGKTFGIAMEGVASGASTEIDVKIAPIYLAPGSVATADIADDAVTLAKLYNIARGSVIVGGTADAPTALNAKDTTKFLQGDGTDLKSVAISQDATVASGGALTIAALAVTTGKLANNAVTSGKIDTSVIQTVSTTLDAATIKTLFSASTDQGIELVTAPGTNKFIEFISASVFLDHSGSTAFDADNGLRFNVGAIAVSNLTPATFLEGTADRIAILQALTPATATDNTAANLANKALFFSEGTADPTGVGATSSLKVHATYRIHDFA